MSHRQVSSKIDPLKSCLPAQSNFIFSQMKSTLLQAAVIMRLLHASCAAQHEKDAQLGCNHRYESPSQGWMVIDKGRESF